MMPDSSKANFPMIRALNATRAKKPSTNGNRAAALSLNRSNRGNKYFRCFFPPPPPPFPRAEKSYYFFTCETFPQIKSISLNLFLQLFYTKVSFLIFTFF